MTLSTFVARVLGLVLIVIGLGVLLEGETYRSMATEYLRDTPLIYFSGVVMLAVGLAIVIGHNLWVADWRVLVTIFGWLFLIDGVLHLLAGSWVQNAWATTIAYPNWPIICALIMLVLGGILTAMGYQDLWGQGRSAGASAPKRR